MSDPTTSRDLLAEVGQPFVLQPLHKQQSAETDQRQVHQCHVMIVDDEPINIKLVRKVLREAGYRSFTEIVDPRDTIAAMRKSPPDIVLLDIMMPHISGLEILEAIRSISQLSSIPVLILTASSDRATKLEALDLGATDFLSKPVDRAELVPRIRNTLTVKLLLDHAYDHAALLEDEVRKRTQEIVTSRLEVVHCLARAAEFHDDVTGKHVVRVGRYAGLIGQYLGLNYEQLHLLELAAQLHDVGKIGIPTETLNKPGKLSPREYSLVKAHCELGQQMMGEIDEQQWDIYREHPALGGQLLNATQSPLMQMASRIAMTHHEHYDGSGYPNGLRGDEIPLEGRITAVADVFDALSCKRPYKDAYPTEKCFEIIQSKRGSQFDPDIVDALIAVKPGVIEIMRQYRETKESVQ